MADVISEYQKWKQQGEDLRTQAKQAMEARYRELLSQAVAIAEEYRSDFGGALKPPPHVTAFRYKASGRPKGKKAAKPTAGKPAEPVRAEPPKPQKMDHKVVKLEQRLAAAKKKLEDAKASGSATRPLEDRIYEIEDAIRLAR